MCWSRSRRFCAPACAVATPSVAMAVMSSSWSFRTPTAAPLARSLSDCAHASAAPTSPGSGSRSTRRRRGAMARWIDHGGPGPGGGRRAASGQAGRRRPRPHRRRPCGRRRSRRRADRRLNATSGDGATWPPLSAGGCSPGSCHDGRRDGDEQVNLAVDQTAVRIGTMGCERYYLRCSHSSDKKPAGSTSSLMARWWRSTSRCPPASSRPTSASHLASCSPTGFHRSPPAEASAKRPGDGLATSRPPRPQRSVSLSIATVRARSSGRPRRRGSRCRTCRARAATSSTRSRSRRRRA